MTSTCLSPLPRLPPPSIAASAGEGGGARAGAPPVAGTLTRSPRWSRPPTPPGRASQGRVSDARGRGGRGLPCGGDGGAGGEKGGGEGGGGEGGGGGKGRGCGRAQTAPPMRARHGAFLSCPAVLSPRATLARPCDSGAPSGRSYGGAGRAAHPALPAAF